MMRKTKAPVLLAAREQIFGDKSPDMIKREEELEIQRNHVRKRKAKEPPLPSNMLSLKSARGREDLHHNLLLFLM
jgi:hypothetical protein